MKSDRQVRARELAALAASSVRRTIVIEFAGLPKAGKSSTLASLQMFLKRCGFRAEAVIERASVCPIRDKKHSHFNVWTACTTLAQILEKTQEPPRADDPSVILLDRGLFDAICWFRIMERLRRLRPGERACIESFLRLEDWRRKLNGVILMTANPADSLKREQGLLPVSGSRGSIMNVEVLQQLRSIYDEAASELALELLIVRVDTSEDGIDTPQGAAEFVADKVLDLIEDALQEQILSLPSVDVGRFFGSTVQLGPKQAEGLEVAFLQVGKFNPRRQIEKDLSRIQALPVVVVRNASGELLVLLRKEASARNPLHEKKVLWAGGHVREEDGPENSIRYGATRELQEELRLSILPSELRLLGAVLDRSNPRSASHVAIVFEWRAPSDEVAIALSTDEFFERHGTSLSGYFVPLGEVAKMVEANEISEPWSVRIAQVLLDEEAYRPEGRLI